MNAARGTYRELEARWKALGARADVAVREIPYAKDRALLLAELGEARRPTIAIAAGVHGDEPAGPWALLELVESRLLDLRFSYQIWPCTNPTGLDARTRANADGVDINRTFGRGGGSPEARTVIEASRARTFTLSLDLHEDCDATGFYCYEYGGGQIGRSILAVLSARGFPIDPLEVTFGVAGPLEDKACVREWGRVVADAFREASLLGGLSYSLALAQGGTRHALTFETPSSAAWEARLAMHRTGVLAAVSALLEESDSTSCN